MFSYIDCDFSPLSSFLHFSPLILFLKSFLLNCLFSLLLSPSSSCDGLSCSRSCFFLFSVFVLCWAVGFGVPPVFALWVQWENQQSPLGGRTGGGSQKDSGNGVQVRLNWKTHKNLVMSLLSDLLKMELKTTGFVPMRHLGTPLELELSKHKWKTLSHSMCFLPTQSCWLCCESGCALTPSRLVKTSFTAAD